MRLKPKMIAVSIMETVGDLVCRLQLIRGNVETDGTGAAKLSPVIPRRDGASSTFERALGAGERSIESVITGGKEMRSRADLRTGGSHEASHLVPSIHSMNYEARLP